MINFVDFFNQLEVYHKFQVKICISLYQAYNLSGTTKGCYENFKVSTLSAILLYGTHRISMHTELLRISLMFSSTYFDMIFSLDLPRKGP